MKPSLTMKHFTDKYFKAWSTLADLIARKDAKRACALFKLLAQSIDDLGYTSKLKGDMLWALGDPSSTQAYECAVDEYCKKGQLGKAISIYEQLSAISDDDTYTCRMQELLEQIKQNTKA